MLVESEFSVSVRGGTDFQCVFQSHRIENCFQIVVSVRAFFRDGKSQVYFVIGKSELKVIYYFTIYDLLFAVPHMTINHVLNVIREQS